MQKSFPVYYAHVYDDRSSQWLTAYSFRPDGDGNKALEGHFSLCGHLVDYSMWSADSEVAESKSGEYLFFHGGGSVGYSALEVVNGAAEGRGCYFRELGERGHSMKRVRDATRCDTATARKLGAAGGLTLYKTKSRKFFFADGRDLRIIPATEAYSWLAQNIGKAAAESAFAEEERQRITVDLPASLLNKIDAARDADNRSRRAVIESALRQVFGNA